MTMIKGLKQIVSLTMISRVFGLVRDLSCNYFFGATALGDAFWMAFKIPNLTRRIFGEGAASASFIPVYSQELETDKVAAQKLASTVLTVVVATLSVIVVAGWFVMFLLHSLDLVTCDTKVVLSLASVMLPYSVMICSVAILAGILNSHFHFAMPAAAPIVLNLCIISGVIVSGLVLGLAPETQVYAVAVSILVAGVIQIAMQFFPLHALGIHLRVSWDVKSDGFRKIMLLMGPMILGLTVTQLNTLGDDLIAWIFSGSQEKGVSFILGNKEILYPLQRGSITHLYFAQRLYQFPLGVFGISLATAIFPVLANAAAKKDIETLCATISKGIKLSLFVALPATVGLALVAKPLVSLMLEHGKSFGDIDVDKTSFTLIFYAIGLSGYFMQQILTRAFYSMQDSKVPARSAIIAVCVNLMLNLVLIWFIGTGGLALSTAICSYLQVFILMCVLKRKLHHSILEGLSAAIVKTFIATTIMAIVGLAVVMSMNGLSDFWLYNTIRIIFIIAATVITYIAVSKLLKIEMLDLLLKKHPQ